MLFSKRTFLWTVAILSAPSANMADHGKKNGGKKGCETPDTTCDLDPDVVVITECDTTIPPRGEEGTPTYFVLEADLVCDGTTNGITINGDNVILDCQGFNVVNESPDLLFNGIEIFDATNVLVTNCGVTGWSDGIIQQSEASALLQNIRAFGNFDGIQLEGNFALLNSQATGNLDDGIVVGGSGLIVGSTSSFNLEDGIDVDFNANVVIFNTEVIGNGEPQNDIGSGLDVADSATATVAQSVFCENLPLDLDTDAAATVSETAVTCDTSTTPEACDCPCPTGKGKGGKKGLPPKPIPNPTTVIEIAEDEDD